MFQESFPLVLRVFERSSWKILEKFQRCFKDISGKFQGRLESFLSASRKFQWCFKED